MRLFLLIAAITLFSSTSWGFPSYSSQWAHRSVIYFAPTNDEHVKQFLLETLINKCQLQGRDLIALVVTEDGFTQPKWVKYEFNLNELFAVYNIEPGSHTAVLIGKDGHEKLRWGSATDWEQVKRVIDRMPMRKREMATKASPCSA